jgi:hypothetical protein
MTLISAGPSPSWLGVLAALSFSGLVVTAFASGYHLASAAPLSTEGSAAATASAESGSGAASDPAVDSAAAFAPIAGKVAEPLVDRDRAVLLARPSDGEEIDELPAGRSITISRESGDWLFIHYQRDGKEHEGWAHRVNIEREEP